MQNGPSMPSTQSQPEPGTPPSSPSPHQPHPVEDFKCNICLNIASDAVLTFCGHLFCWPCLYTWLHYHSRHKECPVCKGAAGEARLIPIYSWGCKDAADLPKALGNSNKCIPPRPPARRIESQSDRQRRPRYQAERARRIDQPAGSDVHYPTLNQVFLGLHECSSPSDIAVGHAPNSLAPSTSSSNRNASDVNAANANRHVTGRDTRASWLERLRAMREERLVWPVAFVQGLTSRELLQQRRQAREHTQSPRLSLDVMPDGPMVDAANSDAAGWYSPFGRAQSGALQRALSLASLDRDLRHMTQNQSMPALPLPSVINTNHTAQYLATMSSILSSMEVFAKALELSSSNSFSQSPLPSAMTPHPMQVFNTPTEEHALWQSSIRGLLAQMERLTLQLQSMSQPLPHSNSATHNYASQSHWMNNANVPPPAQHHHHHHHHYHMDGSLSDRSALSDRSVHIVHPLAERGFLGGDYLRHNAVNVGSELGLSPRPRMQGDMNVNMANPTVPHGERFNSQASSPVFPIHLNQFTGQGGACRDFQKPNSSKSRKRWDVTKMSK